LPKIGDHSESSGKPLPFSLNWRKHSWTFRRKEKTMLIPIRHENMEARRWPVITLALIAMNAIVFLFTTMLMSDEAPQLGEVKSDILILAALHPELKMQPQAQQLVDGFKKSHPTEWAQVRNPYRDVISPFDGKIKLMEAPQQLQDEMDSLTEKYME